MVVSHGRRTIRAMALQVDTGTEAVTRAARSPRTVNTVLLVLEDGLVRELLAVHLRAAGCFPLAVADLSAARRLVSQVVPNVIVVDLNEGNPSSLKWALEVATQQHSRLVFTVALVGASPRVDPDDIAGVDLCVEKPYEPRVLVRCLLQLIGPARRPGASKRQSAALKSRCIELEPGQPTVRVLRGDGWHALDLPNAEHRLLAHLLSDPGRVHSREAIRKAVWPEASIDLRTVDQSVRRLRRSLSKVDAQHLVKTVNGVGYRLVPDLP
jgi:two-component system phosphate regulon response regulator PhoB